MTLSDAMAAARAGRREEARALLMRVLETDERNAQAWLWLSGVVDDPEEMRVCLSNVLHLDPTNAHALKGMAILDQRYGKPQLREVGEPMASPAAPPTPAAELPLATPAPAAEVSTPTAEVAAPIAEAAPPVPAAPPSEPVAAPASGDVAPCPCCGAMMALKLRRCTQCSRPMLVHTPPNPEEGSRSLTLLAFLWMLPVIIAFVIVIFLWGPLTMSMDSSANLLLDGASRVIALIILTVASLPAILIARGLFLRRRWAFIVAVILLALNTLGFLQRFVEFVIMVSQSDDIQMLTSSTMIMVVLLFVLVISFLWISFQGFLLYRGYPKVFGRKVRFVHTVGAGKADEHYNTGIALKDQGMWYAAMLEWEAAVYTSPKDTHYMHALALAQAQLKQRDKALVTMKNAMSLEPSNAGLQETFRLIQQGQI